MRGESQKSGQWQNNSANGAVSIAINSGIINVISRVIYCLIFSLYSLQLLQGIKNNKKQKVNIGSNSGIKILINQITHNNNKVTLLKLCTNPVNNTFYLQ